MDVGMWVGRKIIEQHVESVAGDECGLGMVVGTFIESNEYQLHGYTGGKCLIWVGRLDAFRRSFAQKRKRGGIGELDLLSINWGAQR